MTTIPDIKKLREKSDDATDKSDAENLGLAIKYVVEKMNNLSAEQLKARKISLIRKQKNPLGDLTNETMKALVESFENSGYKAKWREEHIGGHIDYDTEEYFDVSWA
jgi:hypothetical protein